VKWGYSYADLKNMSLDEYNKYILLLNKYYKEKNERAAKAAAT